MVGIRQPSTSGPNGTTPFVAGDVVFRPREFTGTITNDWATVPFCNDDFADYDNPSIDHLSSINDPVTGIGDICRYMGVVDGSHWRIPTASEIAEFYGSAATNGGQSVKLGNGWTVANYYPLSGRAMGPNRNSVTITGNGVDARVTNSDPNTDGAVFLPANGLRNFTDGGKIWWIGSHGFYWSSTSASTGNGYDMGFNSTTVNPQWSDPRAYAFPIRCIRE